MSQSLNEPSRTTLELSHDLEGFFQEVVEEATQEVGFTPTCAAGTYVVGLLTDYAKTKTIAEPTFEKPLTLQLDEALQTTGKERFDKLRALGDNVLYFSGFFREHFEKRGVEVRYVSALGARAYSGISSMLRHVLSADQSPDIFRELSEEFTNFVGLVSHTAQILEASTLASSDRTVLRLYERWLRSRSNKLTALLSQRGIVPLPGAGGVH